MTDALYYMFAWTITCGWINFWRRRHRHAPRANAAPQLRNCAAAELLHTEEVRIEKVRIEIGTIELIGSIKLNRLDGNVDRYIYIYMYILIRKRRARRGSADGLSPPPDARP